MLYSTVWNFSQFAPQITVSFSSTITIIFLLYVLYLTRDQSCPALGNPMDCSQPGSSIRGISKTRILEWVAISSPGDLPDSVIEPMFPVSPELQADSLSSEPLEKLHSTLTIIIGQNHIEKGTNKIRLPL